MAETILNTTSAISAKKREIYLAEKLKRERLCLGGTCENDVSRAAFINEK